MAIYDAQGVRKQREIALQEKKLRLQNDPGRIFLKAIAQAAPQATFNALGQIAVKAADYELFGGRKQLDESISLGRRQQDEVEKTGKATRRLNVRKQQEVETARQQNRISETIAFAETQGQKIGKETIVVDNNEQAQATYDKIEKEMGKVGELSI